ncbi:hypothetical protein N7537_005030 [Penicillium hordei]|uniref:Uncharacterized protein n=1 Tax=Penicillium hordei TaxID=40994 RepID=A0AAD6H5D6_9EURO|nr:uncharacterized protein N7537_005030 [Penicillium hordei]KAJ5608411.1 hypothetical protein N7537_005030 [Penicillium hordei]
MLPPSDSLRHHLNKLAEVRANRNTSISTSTPTSTSTPGTAPPPYTLSVTRPSGTTVMSVDQNDMDDPWASPINIYIDNSITVTGDENTILVSSGADSPTDPTHQGAQGSPRLSSIAAVIIAALNRANALHDDMGYPRPINIRALAGIRVNGQNNNICVGGEVQKSQNETANGRAEERNRRKRRASSVRTLLRQKIFKKLNY